MTKHGRYKLQPERQQRPRRPYHDVNVYAPDGYGGSLLHSGLLQAPAASGTLPVNSLQELIAYGKKDKRGLFYASSGNGSIQSALY